MHADDDLVERAIARCLALAPDARARAVDALCAAEPQQDSRIRAGLSALADAGLLADSGQPAMPAQVGGYAVVRELGRGGMGIVYLAQRADGTRAAVKLVRPGLLFFPGARQRFLREIGAVARLEHPSIVGILDFGEACGVPYFAMQYVHGAPLAAVVDALRGSDPAALAAQDLWRAVAAAVGLEPAALAYARAGSYAEAVVRLAAQVADALDHAHRRGVLHRDVKPANVMLATDGRALLCDFGLARCAETADTSQSGTVIGSLPYLPPERLGGKRAPPGAQSDVYALGVTMYELLALRRPFASDDPEELRRAILAGSAPALRACNRAVPEAVARICGKAMEPDLDRRYGSAREMLADLENALVGKPVAARPPGLWRRARRAVRARPRLALGALLAALAVVAAALGLRSSSWRRAHDEQRQTTRAVTTLVHGQIDRATTTPARMPRADARRFLAETAQQVVAVLAARPPMQASLLARVADAYLALGFYADAAQTLEGALALYDSDPDATRAARAESWNDLGVARAALHDRRGAEQSYGNALALHDPATRAGALGRATCLHNLGQLARQQGELDAAERALREALTLRERHLDHTDVPVQSTAQALAVLLLERGQAQQALALAQEAAQHLGERQGRASLAATAATGTCGLALAHLRRFAEAEQVLHERTLLRREAFGDDHPAVAEALVHEALCIVQGRGVLADAEPLVRQALAIQERAFGAGHAATAECWNNIGSMYYRRGSYGQAARCLREALHLEERGGDTPLLATIASNLATALQADGDRDAAEVMFARALELIRGRFGERDPRLAQTLTNYALLLERRGRVEEAERCCADALAILEAVDAQSPRIAPVLDQLAVMRRRARDYAQAEELYRRSLELRRAGLPAAHPDLAFSLFGLGRTLVHRKRWVEAEPLLREAIRIRADALSPEHRLTAGVEVWLGICLERQGRIDEAEACLQRATDVLLATAGEDSPEVSEARFALRAVQRKKQ